MERNIKQMKIYYKVIAERHCYTEIYFDEKRARYKAQKMEGRLYKIIWTPTSKEIIEIPLGE